MAAKKKKVPTKKAPTLKKVTAKKEGGKKATAKKTAKKVAQKAKTKPKAKAASKPAAKPKPKAETAQKNEDFISKTVETVEKLSNAQAFQKIASLETKAKEDLFLIGGLMANIKENQLYLDRGFETMRTFIDESCAFSVRTIEEYIKIYNNLRDSGVDGSKIIHIGWTKIGIISPWITMENYEELVGIAEESSAVALREYVKKLNTDDPDLTATGPKDWGTKTFRVHVDQREVIDDALAKAGAAIESEDATMQLETLALAYLEGGKPKKPNKTMLKPVVKDAGWETTLEAVEEIYPHIEISVVENELEEETPEPEIEEETPEPEAEAEEPEPEAEEPEAVEGELVESELIESGDAEEAGDIDDGEPEYDEDGNLIEYYEEGELDENGNPIEYEGEPEVGENGEIIEYEE